LILWAIADAGVVAHAYLAPSTPAIGHRVHHTVYTWLGTIAVVVGIWKLF
jgi:hypothetical protein